MERRWRPGFLLAAWLVAEVLTFLFVVRVIGFWPAILLGGLASVLGVVRLRRLGSAALAGLRAAASGRPSHESAVVDGALAALGALLLLLPGFLTDVIGLVLSAPSGRDWARARLGLDANAARPRPARAGVVDLDATHWTRLDTPRGR